ncbi:hypothetical protein CLQ_14148 (plasmid) [Clostridium botulinum Af84]|uniref:hypothetical protein n=1 Tax=Clostridium botulinum TaxID=1491 RepID=UPI00035BB285|nr:hypothetical protein [Clostridium botulinum]APR02762.1 hypothetical protein RSJ2_3693 [Clostridium botulinum]EPS54435.1 hypothetical protein CLQ_14148 [Clostridium botulinum Af84]NFM82830.1 hypothetical protein [Clostridium botulinum]NFP10048.1 hypothetical protein [Clostridium botulinum]NFR28549.1 hypothetical protein [Clostridium botulinum]
MNDFNMFTYIINNKLKIDELLNKVKSLVPELEQYSNNISKYLVPQEEELLDSYRELYSITYNLQIIVNTLLNYNTEKAAFFSCPLDKSQVLNHKVQYENNIISIKIAGILPTKIRKKDYTFIKQYWIGTIVYAIKSLNLEKTHEKIFVKIKFHIRHWSDVENRFIKFLIDGIRYSALIIDDDYKHLSYMVDGVDIEKDNNEYTEMFITTYENKINIINL